MNSLSLDYQLTLNFCGHQTTFLRAALDPGGTQCSSKPTNNKMFVVQCFAVAETSPGVRRKFQIMFFCFILPFFFSFVFLILFFGTGVHTRFHIFLSLFSTSFQKNGKKMEIWLELSPPSITQGTIISAFTPYAGHSASCPVLQDLPYKSHCVSSWKKFSVP